MQGPESSMPTQERLIGDLRQVIENAEELLRNTGRYTGEHYQSARAKLTEALEIANAELARIEDVQLERMIAATQAAAGPDLSGEARLFQAFRQ
jgi:ElaB/YqjD/DUF883 family membrane-anchored ribosome-binding protein